MKSISEEKNNILYSIKKYGYLDFSYKKKIQNVNNELKFLIFNKNDIYSLNNFHYNKDLFFHKIKENIENTTFLYFIEYLSLNKYAKKISTQKFINNINMYKYFYLNENLNIFSYLNNKNNNEYIPSYFINNFFKLDNENTDTCYYDYDFNFNYSFMNNKRILEKITYYDPTIIVNLLIDTRNKFYNSKFINFKFFGDNVFSLSFEKSFLENKKLLHNYHIVHMLIKYYKYDTKENILEYINDYKHDILDIIPKFKDDKDIVISSLINNPKMIKYAHKTYINMYVKNNFDMDKTLNEISMN